jgi:cell division protein FtsL
MKLKTEIQSKIGICLIAVAIPSLLVLDVVQAKRYGKLKKQVDDLESKQVELVEENKKLITDISVLSSADRIETIAAQQMGMHKAKTDEIVRVEIKGGEK